LSEPPGTIVAYADGSCIGNPGPGGWGVVILTPDAALRELSGAAADTTNNRMELTAAIEALRHVEARSKVVLRSDSEYVVRGINENRKRKANLDLWAQLDAEIAQRQVSLEWVRGHADDGWNARADELARAQAERRPPRGAPPSRRESQGAARNPSADDTTLRELEPLLGEGETIRVCAACCRRFVSKRALYCTQIECQLKARRAASRNQSR
jgi:ribonuclease HI